MILFLDDWKKYPGAIADVDTKNRSWYELARLYHYMGIKNHMFPLALVNKKLKGIDPFDEDLPLMTQAAIAYECKINHWYYFREVARVPAGSGESASPLLANRGNVALFWMFFNHVTTFLIQIRQTGKSVSVDELATYLLNIRCRSTDINLLTKDDQLRAKNIKRLKDIDVELPPYLKQRTKADANNTEIITIKSLGNTFTTHVPQASPKAADKVGRGLTSPIFFVDESPFQVNAQISISAALAAGNDARDRAARNDEPYGTIFTTTAGKKDTKEGAYIYRLKSDSAPFTERFFDVKDVTELESVIRKSSRTSKGAGSKSGRGAFRVDITMNHKQLGKTDEWLYRKIEENVSDDEEQIDRDLFNRWTSGGLTSPLSIERMETIRGSEREPNYVEISKQCYTTNWFIPENQIENQLKSGPHILSMDTSDASGGDDISLRLIDASDGRLIASGNYNETNIITFSLWVADWFIRFRSIIGIIERRSTGVAVLDQLLLILPAAGIDPFKCLFNRAVNDAEEDKDRFAEINQSFNMRSPDIYVKYKKCFGFATSGSGITSRSELYSTTLQAAAKQVGDVVYDKATIDQILSLLIKNGRVDHPAGEHDDMCFIGSTLVRTINGNREIKDLKLGDLVLTRAGYKPIVKLFKSDKPVITKFGITGTANHPFITPNGEVEFKDLNEESKVYFWNEKRSCIEERVITDTLNLNECNIVNISTGTTNGMNLQSRYIGKFTKTIKDLYQKVITSITRTTITSTTTLTTSNAYPLGNISKDIKKQEIFAPKKDKKEENKVLLSGVKIIQSLQDKSLLKTVVKVLDLLSGKQKTQNLQDKFIAKQERKPEVQIQTVYNLMVDECHEYFVNDILVHNCIAWLLGHWFLTQATNLSYYGIDTTRILYKARQRIMKENMGNYDFQKQERIREELKQVLEKIKNERDEYILANLESRAKYLDSRMDKNENETITIEELIAQSKENNKARKLASANRYQSNSNNLYTYLNDPRIVAAPIVDPTRGHYY